MKRPRVSSADVITVSVAVLSWALAARRRRHTAGVPLESLVLFRATQACQTVAHKVGRLGIAAEAAYWRSVRR